MDLILSQCLRHYSGQVCQGTSTPQPHQIATWRAYGVWVVHYLVGKGGGGGGGRGEKFKS